jgi:glutaredoxin-like protein NrdH
VISRHNPLCHRNLALAGQNLSQKVHLIFKANEYYTDLERIVKKMVKVYSKNNCMQCKMVKKFLDEHHIAYQEYNIENEPEYRDYVISLGYQAVPVVETSAGTSFYGFRPDQLKTLA